MTNPSFVSSVFLISSDKAILDTLIIPKNGEHSRYCIKKLSTVLFLLEIYSSVKNEAFFGLFHPFFTAVSAIFLGLSVIIEFRSIGCEQNV